MTTKELRGAEKAHGASLQPARTIALCACPVTAHVECHAGAGPDDASASPGCSDEEQSALAKLTPLSTLADPTTVIALLSVSVQHFDAEAMALTEPVGAVALSWAATGEDAESHLQEKVFIWLIGEELI